MAPTVTDTSGPIPLALLAPLQEHLPHSFSVLRRGQFTHRPGGTSEHAHFLFATDDKLARQDEEIGGSPGQQQAAPKHFAAAYLDLSQHPSTEMFFYSTLQDVPQGADATTSSSSSALSPAEVDLVLDLAVAIFQRARDIASATAADNRHVLGRPGGTMVGNLHEATYRLLVERRGFTSSYWNPHDVWLFRVDELPVLPAELLALETADFARDGLRWAAVRREDVPLIASRTKIPKVADHLMCEPNVGVRNREGVLVAWGFMGNAGTLSTLHVEEPYRGKGLAKAVATKVLRQHNFGDDGWGSADVHIDNVQSQGLCKSIGGKKGLRTSW
ncbi:hypothetical protein M406DRAFT_260529 [Cryphonectria parasitica EP155]|uniref:GCN5-related N-acetyltransferase Rv2170-like domain-containing protein n=1 Tax=Cryphonectria parasitica (strain ATCC 38755 / EP155) TaxID=660469 RepID=A0A9P5CNA5_CRYP1|nr:uncharacterized protein M406DRAFT_260529 [Cryphonectria parasitica EP155]KAF3764958.1 hypothetical protein M406DRAFT_260529 [Cryphonectria parasitica EP155]